MRQRIGKEGRIGLPEKCGGNANEKENSGTAKLG